MHGSGCRPAGRRPFYSDGGRGRAGPGRQDEEQDHPEVQDEIPGPSRPGQNWAAYEDSLRKRGDITVWFDEDAVDAWNAPPSGRPGGQRKYSELAIVTALTLRTVFRLSSVLRNRAYSVNLAACPRR